MERTHYQSSNCSIARTLEVLGEKWTFLVIREAFYGSTRFAQFQEILECPKNLLSDRLSMLVDEGILERREYREPGSRARMEYVMTDSGRDLMYILLALRQWGDRHKADAAGPPVVSKHIGCGEEISVAFLCEKGHVITSADEVEMAPGPGLLPLAPA